MEALLHGEIQVKPIFYQLLSGLLVLLLLSSGAQPVAAQGGGTIVGRGGIRHLATSPDGKYIAVASTIGIWLYEAADVTKQPRFISGHTEEVQQVAFSSDGTKLASASLDRTAGLWDVQTGARLQRFEGARSGFYAVAFSPDDSLVAAATTDQNAIRLWESNSGRPVGILQGHRGQIVSLAFSADGKQIASGASDQSVRLWDVERGVELRALEDIKARVTIVAYSLMARSWPLAARMAPCCSTRRATTQWRRRSRWSARTSAASPSVQMARP